jgi:hypothetical protein
MSTISITYSLKWQFKELPFYKMTGDGKLFNCRTGRIKKECLNGGSYGFWIGKNFVISKDLRKQIELIPKREFFPF